MVTVLAAGIAVLTNLIALILGWGWFIEPLGAPPLRGVWHALGLSMVVAIVTNSKAVETIIKSARESGENAALVGVLLGAPLAIGLLWLVAWLAGLT